MLTVPAQIQTLFKTDGIRKNFRVHFPNGENTDLTNSDIVQESVTFTESVCSRSNFQFGLSERSQIEFECVGVQNIYGITIECGIEIDTSSLSAADIAAIEADPGDGILVKAADSDIGFGFYRVPYGVFRVESCPRSHGAMWRRKVTAYSPAYSMNTSALTKKKFNYVSQTGDNMTINVYAQYAGEAGSLDGLDYTTSTAPGSTSINSGLSVLLAHVGNDYYTLEIESVEEKTVAPTISTQVYALMRSTCTYDKAFLNWVRYVLPSGAEISKQAYSYIMPYVRWGTGVTDSYTLPDPEDTGVIYPYASNIASHYSVSYVTSITVRIEKNGTVVGSRRTYLPCSNIAAEAYTLTGLQKGMIVSFAPTYNVGSEYRYFGAVDWAELYNGLLELNGAFGRPDRSGGIEEVQLSKASPVAISPSQYSDLWWDDWSIDSIGTIMITYRDADQGQEQTIEYIIGSGASVYEMTSNYMLKQLAATSSFLGVSVQDYVQNLIDTHFIPNIGDIAFDQADGSMIALPYMEAGDYMELDNGAGGTVGTYALTRRISGIQTLEDSFEAKGGEVLGG